MNDQKNDVLIIGGGIIGVSLALELRKRGVSVRVLERGEPGREASHAGAGMLAAKDPDTPEVLRELLLASSRMYPEWVRELEEESGVKTDLRTEGTIYLSEEARVGLGQELSKEEVGRLDAGVRAAEHAYFTDEGSIDPRALMAAATAAAKRAGAVISHEHPVTKIEIEDDCVKGIRAGDHVFSAGVVVNAAGAWAQKIAGAHLPSHPVKGQMLAVVDPNNKTPAIRHVVRGEEIYLVPRSDGRTLIGATVEKVGFDKRVRPEVILSMQHEAGRLVPRVAEMRIHESWAGLRPGSPDKLPLLGETNVRGYFAATGHYRNGILMAPITARTMAKIILREEAVFDLKAFDPKRFS